MSASFCRVSLVVDQAAERPRRLHLTILDRGAALDNQITPKLRPTLHHSQSKVPD